MNPTVFVILWITLYSITLTLPSAQEDGGGGVSLSLSSSLCLKRGELGLSLKPQFPQQKNLYLLVT